MRVIVTAGNTQTPIDSVRCITNIFTGRTGASIAAEAHAQGHAVTLLTSHPDTVSPGPRVLAYRTYDDLTAMMAQEIPTGNYDGIVHCAAVSDYEVKEVLAPSPKAHYDHTTATWVGASPQLQDALAGKVKSHHDELWLRLVPTLKLVDRIRTSWSFRGMLIKFKLEVDVTDEELLRIAEKSRVQSAADAMVANTFEGRKQWAYVGTGPGAYTRVARQELASAVVKLLTNIHSKRT